MTLQHSRICCPLAHLPHTGMAVPAATDDQLPILTDIKGANVGAVAKQQCIGVVVEGFAGLAHIDDLVLAAGDDEAFGEVGGGRHNGQRVDELLALDLDGAIVGWWGVGLELP